MFDYLVLTFFAIVGAILIYNSQEGLTMVLVADILFVGGYLPLIKMATTIMT